MTWEGGRAEINKNVTTQLTFKMFRFLWSTLNGFQNRAAFVSLQFVGFQPGFQVLGAASHKYGESSGFQKVKAFSCLQICPKWENFCWALSFIIEHILTDPRQNNFLSLNFDILDFDSRADMPQPVLTWSRTIMRAVRSRSRTSEVK